jgi:hypothetical protein
MTEIEVLQSFRRNGPGSWSCIKPITIGAVSMGPGVSFTRGVSMSGVNMAEQLDQLAAKYPGSVVT